MSDDQLLPNEIVITSSDSGTVTLTTHRIWRNESSRGQANLTSIMLQNVSSIEVNYKSWFLALVLGALGTVGSFFMIFIGNQQGETDLVSGGLFVLFISIILFILYWVTRRHVINVASKGGASIEFTTKGVSRDDVVAFVDKIERAINDRYFNVRTIGNETTRLLHKERIEPNLT